MLIFHYFLVNIEDVNDNAPVYEQTEYRRVVRIGDDAFQPPLVVKATDKDGPLQVKIIFLILLIFTKKMS